MIVAQPMYPRRAALSLIYLALVYQGCIFHSALATLFSHYPTLIGNPTEWFASHPRIMRVFSNCSLSACLSAAVGHPAHLPASVRHSILLLSAFGCHARFAWSLEYIQHSHSTRFLLAGYQIHLVTQYQTLSSFIVHLDLSGVAAGRNTRDELQHWAQTACDSVLTRAAINVPRRDSTINTDSKQ